MAQAAGGLIHQPSSSTSPTPGQSPTPVPQVLAQVTQLFQPKTQKKAIEEVKKSVSNVIKAPAQTIARSLDINPYDDKTLSYNTSASLITFALGSVLLGLALLKPNILYLLKIRKQKKAQAIKQGIQTSI